jgi:hypothetical protein
MNEKEKEMCREAVKLLDDLCNAYKVILFTDDKRIRDELEEASNKSNSDALLIAFVQGAKWWEYHTSQFTMWPSDIDIATVEAERRLDNATLGIKP